MKPLLFLTALLLSSFAIAGSIGSGFTVAGSNGDDFTVAAAIDDPPPEPMDCPLCGGDPAIHVRRMFGMTRFSGSVVSYSLRW